MDVPTRQSYVAAVARPEERTFDSGIFTFAQAEKPAAPQATTSEWKPLDDAMGRSGQMQPGDVIKFAMPRKDLKVVVNGVNVKPGLALGSRAAFKREGSSAMVMGG